MHIGFILDLTSVARLSVDMCEATLALHSSILFLLLTVLTHPAGSNIANLCPTFAIQFPVFIDAIDKLS